MTGKNLSKDGQEYRLLFEEAPLPMCVVDSAGVKEYLDRLRDAGVTDLIDHFAMDPEDLIACFSLVRVLDVNVCALRLSGAADKQEFGERLGELLCEESYPLMMKELLAMADQREDKQGETVIRTFKGEKLSVLVKWTVMPGTPIPYSRVLISATDVTGRVAMEDQLKAAAAEWRDTFDANQDLVFILDRDFRVIRANAAAARFLQMPEREIAGHHCYELMHGTEEPVEGCPLAAMKGTDEHAEAELYLENHGIWAHISVDPILGRDGGVSRVVHVFRDITERKRTEEKLKESERLYRMLADNTQDLICVCGEEGNRVYVSPSYRSQLGYEPEELLGRHILDIVHPDEYKMVKDEIIKGMGEKEPGRYLHRIRHEDGRYIWAESHGAPIRDEEGKTIGGLTVSWNVTDKVEAEERLRESERLYRVLADNTQDLICMCDTDFIRIYVSPSYEAVLGYKPEELLGVSLFSQLPPEEQVLRKKEFDEMAKGWNPETVRRQVQHKDGHYIWIDTYTIPIRDEGGEVAAWLVASRNVNSQVEAEDRLRESERLYRMLADNTKDLICMCDTSFVRRYISPSYEAVLGYKPEELVGDSLFSQVPAGQEEVKKGEFLEKVKDGYSGIVREKLRHKDGHYVWIETSATALHGEEGEDIGYLIVSRDVSSQAEAEEKLRESERLYRMLADNTQDLISMCDTQGANVYVSPSVRKVLGYEPEELIGQPLLAPVHPDDLLEAVRVFRQNMEAGTSGIMRIRNRRKDGSYVWLESQDTPLFDGEGKPTGALTSSRDVTEQVKAGEMLRNHNEELKDFLAVAAHELRHPICLVQGYANTLADFRNDMDQQTMDEVYASITAASRRLTSLVEELLEVSRIERERFAVERATVNPAYSLRKVIEEMRERGMANPVVIDTDGLAETWPLDPEKFHQLLVILLDNAVKHSPPDSPIEVGLSSGAEGLSLTVSDRGCGVSEEHREKIFQRFFQVEDSGHHSVPGLGLGLYIAREIVEGHGGSIGHEDREGGGSIFRLTIP